MDFEREWNVDAAADRQQAPEPELAALAARVKGDPIQPGSMRTVTPGADGVIVLPAGTDINQIEVDGRNLVVTLPDGTQMVILDGAVVVPRIVVGDIEIPSVNLAALLIGDEPQPAAGPARSSGGNFLAADGDVGDPHALGDLLPPTELSFTQPEEQEILPIAPTEDDEPEIQIVTPDQPAGATSATAVVSEAGLPARGEEPAGSAAAGDSERTTGTIVFSANDGPSVVAIGGVAVTTVGQTFTTPLGVLTITSIESGSIGYSYTLSDNVVGAPPAEVFTVTVTDADGDQATATLTISITDDVPLAADDADSVTEDGPLAADGNVLTAAGGSDANGTDGVADVQGADGVTSVTTGTFEGTYGTLVLSAGGGYRYELANANPAVQFLTPGQTLTDSFSYTITDADGDTSSATLTITINGADDGVTITGLTDGPGANGAELVVLENDLADGSSPDAAALTQGGSFSVSGPDGLTTVTVGGVTVLADGAFVAGQVVTTPLGTLTITGFTATSEQGGVPVAGSFTYSYVLTDNSLDHDAAGADNLFESFAVVATDRNGSTAAGAIDVQIVDDLPVARADVDGVAAGTYGPEGGNVISGAGTVSGAAGADTRGADGAVVAGVSAGAGGAALVNAETVGQVIQGAYGKLTLNGDGSYSYTRDAGTQGGVSDSFTYTLRDGDGDLSTATLRIDIANSDVMIISIPRIGEGTVVDESGLDEGVGPAPGSNADADVETTLGVITYTAPDAPSTVTINGIPVTGAGQLIETDKGYLEIISVSEGRIEYSYTLTANTDNSGGAPVTDSFEVTVTDVDGDSATDTLVITILDDQPTALPDVDFVKEDGPLVADGNVLTGSGGGDANGSDGVADVQGADGATVTAISFGGAAGEVGQEIQGAYGKLLIQEGGGYVYTLDNANGVVQGLDSTETLTETFTYVITDGDNDTAQASLVITIQGSNDGVTINGLSGQGAELTVREDDLLDGSSPDTGELTQANSFTLTAPDGVATITVGGQTIFANGSFVSGVVITNAYGTLTIDGFTPTPGADGDVIGGTVNYSYVLNDNTLLHTGVDGASLTNSFAVEVVDSDGSPASASLDVAVLDDAPQARDDAATQPAEDAAMLINVITGEGTTTGATGADTLGADGVNLAVGGQLVLTSGPAQGTAVYQGNGVFLYTPTAGATGEDQFTYTITDGDGDSSTATVTIVLAGDSTPVVLVSDLTVSEAGLPNGTQAAGNSETASGAMTITTGGDTLAKVEVQGSNGWVDVTGATVGSPVVVQGAAGTLTVTSNGLGQYSYSYTLTANNPTHPDNNPSDGDGISGAADTLPGDSFGVRVTDSDGDVSPSASIDVTVQDDAPILTVGGDTTVVEGATASGTWSQTIGADQPGASTVVLVGANSYAIGTPIDTGLGTLTVNANGTWSFVSNNNLNNALNPSVSFTIQVTDADSDVAQDTQTISITDGAGPTAGDPLSLQMDDQNLADGRTPGADDFASGKISFTAGSDALGFAFAESVATLGGGLTWNRVSDTLIEGWDGPVGTGTKIVALTLTASPLAAGQTGEVTVTATLLNNYDSHPDFTADDIAALGTIAVVASDQDGDSASVAVTLSVSDDIPSLSVDGATTVIEGATASGTWSQTIGADQPGASTVVLVGANSYAIGAPIDTGLGTLTVNANGTWSFVSNNNLNNALNPSVSFTIQVTDADDDVAQDTQTISITDGAGPTAGDPLSLQMDDQNLADGRTPGADDFASGKISFTAGSDALGFAFAASVATLGGGLTWNRVSDTLIEGWDGPVGTGTKIVALTLTASPLAAGQTGEVTVTATLLNNYDSHPTFTADDVAALGNIAVVASDQDGDSASVAVTLSVSDDIPSLSVDGATTVIEGATASGTWSQTIGADQPGASTVVLVGANSYAIGTPIDTGLGTLTVNADSTWSFVSNNNLNNALNPLVSFTIQVTDADDDVAQDTQTISITNGAGPTATKNAAVTVDEEALSTVNALGTNPTSPAEAGSDTVSFLAGSDNITGVAFTTVAGIIANVDGIAGDDIVWTLDSATQITGTIGGTPAITLTLVPPTLPILAGASGSATVSVTISDNFPHPFGGTGNIVISGITVTATDTDNDLASATAQVTVIDDAPIGTAPLAVSVTNSANQTSSAFLDADLDVDNNYGADGGKIIFTQASIDTLIARGLTSGSQAVSYAISPDGLTLTASNSGGSVFTVQLQPASFSDKYVVTMHQPLDSLTTVDFNGGGYDFVGGNGAWAGFSTAGNDNSKDLLLTPMTSGIDGGTMNTNASEGGVSDGNSVKLGEAVRVDFVIDLTGSPEAGKDYGSLANQNHAFEAHYNVNGASALFTSIGNNKTTSVRLVARDDVDADNDIGDGVKDTINAVAISYNGETKQVTANGDVTVGGHLFNVTFSGQEATVTNVVDNTRIGGFTATQYNSIEFHHAGGETFKIGDFFAAVQTTQPVNFTIPVTIIDGDGDSTASGNLSISATAPTSPVPPIALDLDGDGLEFVGLSAGVHHDYGAGLVNTAWVSSDDGLLAHATGGGYDIVFADDAPGAASDLEGLRLAYDSNGDGVFNAEDAAFAEFGVWQDANSNGRVEAGEFRLLTDADIAAIELTSDGASYQAAGGDVTVLGEASYIRADGSKGTVGDVMFATSSLSEASKTTESSSGAFNQALIAASLVAVAGAVEAVEQEPAPVVAEQDASLADAMLASTAPVEEEASLEDSQSTSIGSTEDTAFKSGDEPVAESSHGGDEPVTDQATLADASDAPAPLEASVETSQPDLGDHQGLLAQSIELPAFDGSAALLAVAQSATTTSVAEVVSEALGAIGAPDIDALLAALPGDIAPALFNPIAAEPIDSGHMAFAASVFDAALAAHDAMAVAHG